MISTIKKENPLNFNGVWTKNTKACVSLTIIKFYIKYTWVPYHIYGVLCPTNIPLLSIYVETLITQ